MIHFLYRMVQNQAVSEELAQEVFLRVYRSRATYEPTAKFTTWLFRIAVNLAISHLRKVHRFRVFSLDRPSAGAGRNGRYGERIRRETEPRQNVDAVLGHRVHCQSLGAIGHRAGRVLDDDFDFASTERVAVQLEVRLHAAVDLRSIVGKRSGEFANQADFHRRLRRRDVHDCHRQRRCQPSKRVYCDHGDPSSAFGYSA